MCYNRHDFTCELKSIAHLLTGYARVIEYGTINRNTNNSYNPSMSAGENYPISVTEGRYVAGRVQGFARVFTNEGGCKVGFWKR